MRKRSDLFELVWLVLGVVVIAMIVLMVQGERRRVNIYVANKPLEPGTYVSEDALKVAQWHPDYLPPGTLGEDMHDKIIGAVVVERVNAGEPLLRRQLASAPQDGVAPDAAQSPFSTRASGIIPSDDLRLMSWPLDQGVLNGRVRAGDYIDIILTVRDPLTKNEFTKTLRQRVRVTAITDKDMLFLLTPQEAEEFIFARGVGTVSFTLASANEREIPTSGVNYNTLYRKYLGPDATGPLSPTSSSSQPNASPAQPLASPTPTTLPTHSGLQP